MTEDDRENTGKSARQDELRREGDEHPSAEDIASLLDPGSPANEAWLREHLSTCRRCLAIYVELAETELGWRWSPQAGDMPADLLRAAKAIGGPEATQHAARSRLPLGGRSVWYAIAATVLVVGLGGVLVARLTTRAPAIDPNIRNAVAQASRTGMVLTPDIAPAGATLRGSGLADRQSLAASLNRLALQYDRPGGNEDSAYWLAAGMLAEGDPGVRTVLDDALRRFPNSTRLENLAAVLAYREGRVEEAERGLRAVLAERPEDVVALFNLALLFRERGSDVELTEVRARMLAAVSPGTPLGLRAQSELNPSPHR